MAVSLKFLSLLRDNIKTTDHRGGGPSPVANRSVRKCWVFDVQWSDCPTFIEDEVRELWYNHNCGNDYFIYKAVLDEDLYADYPLIAQWLEYNGVPFEETVWVHWWW